MFINNQILYNLSKKKKKNIYYFHLMYKMYYSHNIKRNKTNYN